MSCLGAHVGLFRLLPYEAGAEIVKNLVGFLGDLKSPKFHSEFNGPLITVRSIFFVFSLITVIAFYKKKTGLH